MTENDLIVLQLEQAFHQRSWHGTNLLGSIRGVKVEEAAWRPGPGRHNIWELIVHAAYWKYTVYRRLAGESKGSFPMKGSNWFERPESLTQIALTADLRILKDYHRRLIAEVKAIGSKKLGEKPVGSRFTYRELAIGAGAHDLYHAGQIQLIKRLRRR